MGQYPFCVNYLHGIQFLKYQVMKQKIYVGNTALGVLQSKKKLQIGTAGDSQQCGEMAAGQRGGHVSSAPFHTN